MSGVTIQEESDGISIVGMVEWRCHECGALTEREKLHWHGERLLCEACQPKGD